MHLSVCLKIFKGFYSFWPPILSPKHCLSVSRESKSDRHSQVDMGLNRDWGLEYAYVCTCALEGLLSGERRTRDRIRDTDSHEAMTNSRSIYVGEACWWTIHPASKQRSEGEKVRIGDDLILVSVSSERYLVSTSSQASFHFQNIFL